MIERVGLPAELEQTAEECTELAKAALKLARILYGENPTPVTEEQAEKDLTEEYSDVVLCAKELDICDDPDDIIDIPTDRKQRLLALAQASCIMADNCLMHDILMRESGHTHPVRRGLKEKFARRGIKEKFADVRAIAEALGIPYDEDLEQRKIERFNKRWEERKA